MRWSEDPNYRLWYSYNIDDPVIQGVELTATWYATPDLTFPCTDLLFGHNIFFFC